MSVFCDWEANAGNPKGRLVLVLFRCAQKVSQWPRPWWYFGALFLAVYEIAVEWCLGIELRFRTQVGPGLRLYHGQALVVHERTVIGTDCTLRQSTTIGNKHAVTGTNTGCPTIGNRVDIGANVVIIGAITIGDDAVIGAGSVVVKDVPAGAVVAGNPARVLNA